MLIRGQLFTLDFTISFIVFMFVFLTLFVLWSGVETQIKTSEAKKDLQVAALSASELLIRSGGHPPNWNSTNVTSIGFAEDVHVLSLSKIEEFLKMDYDTAREILGVGRYHFYINFTDINGNLIRTGPTKEPIAYFASKQSEIDMINEVLNGSGAVWDFYWGSASPPPGECGVEYDCRYRYTHPGPGNRDILTFNLMLDNRSSYKSMLIEDSGIRGEDIDMPLFQEFVREGGLVIYKGQGNAGFFLLINNTPEPDEPFFNMHAEHNPGNPDGTVVALNSFLKNVSIGDAVDFNETSWCMYEEEGDAELHILVNCTGNNCKPDDVDNRGMITYWYYGAGKLYYAADIMGEVDGMNLQDSLEIIGVGLEFGNKNIKDAENIVKVQRVAILNKGTEKEVVNLNMILWE